MAVIQDGTSGAILTTVEPVAADPTRNATLVRLAAKGIRQYKVGAVSGVIGAGLTANNNLFAMRLDPSAGFNAWIIRCRISVVCITPLTPWTAATHLAAYRATGTGATGGTSVAVTVPNIGGGAASEFSTAQGGSIVVATTAALTGSLTRENGGATAGLGGLAAQAIGLSISGTVISWEWEFADGQGDAVRIAPSESFVIGNTNVAFPATATWAFSVEVDYSEGDD